VNRTPGRFTLMAGYPTNVLSEGGLRVARCDFDGDMDHPQAVANAKFFAAAPAVFDALLVALETLSEVQRLSPGYDWNADPLKLTLLTGRAQAVADEAMRLAGAVA